MWLLSLFLLLLYCYSNNFMHSYDEKISSSKQSSLVRLWVILDICPIGFNYLKFPFLIIKRIHI